MIMEFYKNRIVVKSTPENFEKEKCWVKNNTVRSLYRLFDEFSETVTYDDKRKQVEYKKMEHARIHNSIEFIVIRNTDTWEFFERKVTDISVFRDEWEEAIYIITFKVCTKKNI